MFIFSTDLYEKKIKIKFTLGALSEQQKTKKNNDSFKMLKLKYYRNEMHS